MSLAYLYAYSDFVALLSPALDVENHAHHAMQIAIGLDGDIQVTSDTRSISGTGIFIKPDVSHQLDSRGGRTINILIHPESIPGQALAQNLFTQESTGILKNIPDFPANLDCDSLKQFAISLWSPFLPDEEKPKIMDSRVREALDTIKTLPDMKISVDELAETVHLSASRFMALFRESTGIALRRYLLWRRLLVAFDCIMKGQSFTDAAHNSGFADSAHLSRTFKRMFGLTLQTVFYEGGFVQAHLCGDISHL